MGYIKPGLQPVKFLSPLPGSLSISVLIPGTSPRAVAFNLLALHPMLNATSPFTFSPFYHSTLLTSSDIR
ncbi:hypothetical protein [Marinilabilia rubra]|uniref:hypothetical protein n=1 Tax=Marinilabilia rubra TaxID=2162893 RepID=UPI001304FB81|nr:hypothetical protein [Marinilabilia rubra]